MSSTASAPATARERSSRRPPRYQLSFHPAIDSDLAALASDDLDAVQATLDDLAHGRVTGKALGERNVSGDLTGLARVKFDSPTRRPQRFRLIYRPIDATTLDVLAIGLRDQHAIYRTAADRLAPEPPPQPASGGPPRS
ncbi:MAG: type II toxin-antitoxin system RelE family toxin [Acidimicrobiales bacterium]